MTVETTRHLNSQVQNLATITVDEFFSQINWSGVQHPPLNEVELAVDTVYETVGQFFATFPWQGQGDVLSSTLTTDAEEEDLEQLIDSGDVLTLEDLSALF